MKTIWKIIVGLVAIMAGMMALAIIAMFGAQPLLWVFIVFWTIILYRMLPKSFSVWGIFMATIGVCVYLPGGLWIIVGAVYVGFGIYYLFYNDIIDPMTFLIMDRPIDTPAQWYHCYRFFWAGIYLDGVIWFSSVFSSIIIFMYIMYDRYKEKLINFSSQALRGLGDTELIC